MEKNQNNAAPYLFHEGTNYYAYKYFGAHFEDGQYVFRVWAPNAEKAFVTGLFNGWSKADPMYRIDDAGIWECRISPERFGDGYNYKYIFENKGRDIYKSDPYAFYAELAPETSSRFCDISGYKWNDEKWMRDRKKRFTRERVYSQPINIYEVHLESWKRHEDGTLLNYKEIAEELAPYVIQMGYTHIELLPITEYPFDGSWGYQVTGYFAPTSRFGTPKDFMEFVDIMHTAGIGVILDWVPAHFPKDAHGLCEYDGGYLYEYQGQDRMEQADWGTRRFDVGREEVQSFLISSAQYWAGEYHIDGLRVDAVASMLYLDFGRNEGEWLPNVYGDNRCLEAVSFFQKLNSAMATDFPDVMTIAEESSDWPNLTTFENDGLGFTMKWNMGWMNDTLAYAELDPIYRKYEHNKLTFTMMYAFNEKYVLPISHDEVVHGKKSFLDKMPGDYETKFAGARLFFAYMMTLPGKKLSFMSNEIAQFSEWAYKKSVEWFMLKYPIHSGFQLFCARLNHLYLDNPCLWEQDGSWAGFSWLDADNADESIISYRRFDKKGRELTVILNFTPVRRTGCRIGAGYAGSYEEVLNSDSICYGGSGVENGLIKTDAIPWQGCPYSIVADIPPMGAVILRCKRKNRQQKIRNQ